MFTNLALPSGVHVWSVTGMAGLSPESLAPVLTEAAQIGHLIIGTGHDIAFLPRPLQELLRAAGIVPEAMSTPAAARTYNILMAEGRRVAAALIAVP